MTKYCPLSKDIASTVVMDFPRDAASRRVQVGSSGQCASSVETGPSTPKRGELVRGGDAVHLSPKAFDLLATLLRERPRALSKAALRERIWPDTFVSETSLANLVAELRSALGDEARQPRYIRTIHRHGYAFCGAATEDAQAPPERARGRTPVRLFLRGREVALTLGVHPVSQPPCCSEGTVRYDGAAVEAGVVSSRSR